MFPNGEEGRAELCAVLLYTCATCSQLLQSAINTNSIRLPIFSRCFRTVRKGGQNYVMPENSVYPWTGQLTIIMIIVILKTNQDFHFISSKIILYINFYPQHNKVRFFLDNFNIFLHFRNKIFSMNKGSYKNVGLIS